MMVVSGRADVEPVGALKRRARLRRVMRTACLRHDASRHRRRGPHSRPRPARSPAACRSTANRNIHAPLPNRVRSGRARPPPRPPPRRCRRPAGRRRRGAALSRVVQGAEALAHLAALDAAGQREQRAGRVVAERFGEGDLLLRRRARRGLVRRAMGRADMRGERRDRRLALRRRGLARPPPAWTSRSEPRPRKPARKAWRRLPGSAAGVLVPEGEAAGHRPFAGLGRARRRPARRRGRAGCVRGSRVMPPPPAPARSASARRPRSSTRSPVAGSMPRRAPPPSRIAAAPGSVPASRRRARAPATRPAPPSGGAPRRRSARPAWSSVVAFLDQRGAAGVAAGFLAGRERRRRTSMPTTSQSGTASSAQPGGPASRAAPTTPPLTRHGAGPAKVSGTSGGPSAPAASAQAAWRGEQRRRARRPAAAPAPAPPPPRSAPRTRDPGQGAGAVLRRQGDGARHRIAALAQGDDGREDARQVGQARRTRASLASLLARGIYAPDPASPDGAASGDGRHERNGWAHRLRLQLRGHDAPRRPRHRARLRRPSCAPPSSSAMAQLDRFMAALGTGRPVTVACTAAGAAVRPGSRRGRRRRAAGLRQYPRTRRLGRRGPRPPGRRWPRCSPPPPSRMPATPLVPLHSEGVTLVLGPRRRGAGGRGAALADRLDLTVLLTGAEDVAPPRAAPLPGDAAAARAARPAGSAPSR